MNKEKQIHKRDLERLKSLRYMDDDFMTACLADNYEGVELIVRIILGRNDIKIKSLQTQKVLKNLQGHSAVLDVHAVDGDNKEIDIEIQRSDSGAGTKRARYNSSLLDAHMLKPGEDTKNLPDSYVIFITENDIMQGKQPIYIIERYVAIGEDKVLFNDGSHIIYVNGKYRGDDDIGRLMHDFSCTDPDKMHFEALARRARYFKQNEKGVKVMGRFREEITKETELYAAEKIINMGKMSLEEIAECFSTISLEELKEIEAKTMQPT